ncbi:hypothetical protein ACX93W_22810 [Paenibacillus sp. CAU 1782]
MEHQEQVEQKGEDLIYTLNTQWATFPNHDINASLFTDIIGEFSEDSEDFIVLEPSKLIQESYYLQAIPAKDDKGGIVVEIRFKHGKDGFKHYSYQTLDANEVIAMFLDYWRLQKLPDWANWTDITDEF